MIQDYAAIPYRLPLRQPWCSAHGQVGERRGWLIRIATATLAGYGDCAPLPEAGTETFAAAEQVLGPWRGRLIDQGVTAALADLDDDRLCTPAVRCAIETALLDLLARESGQPLRTWLAAGAAHRVEVNEMLGTLGDVTPEAIRMACADGLRVLKIKVGRGDPPTEQAHLTTLARALMPGVSLRLDANGAWNLATAAQFIQATRNLPIEALEEPLRTPCVADLKTLQALAGFPIALDESLHRRAALGDGLAGDLTELPVRRLVLKPPALGGLRQTLATAERAVAAGLEVVVTSSIESAAGIWPTVQLAAALPTGQPPQGLATSTWLHQDLGEPPWVSQGQIQLPAGPGSGFRPWLAGTAARSATAARMERFKS